LATVPLLDSDHPSTASLSATIDFEFKPGIKYLVTYEEEGPGSETPRCSSTARWSTRRWWTRWQRRWWRRAQTLSDQLISDQSLILPLISGMELSSPRCM
jgi:hypothetical protein